MNLNEILTSIKEISLNCGKFSFKIKRELITKANYYISFYFGVKPYFEQLCSECFLPYRSEIFYAAENLYYEELKKNKGKLLPLNKLDSIFENAKTHVYINHRLKEIF